ncbi:cysteine-rich secretory protein 2-like [Watersipora subatra]|uniref:cysteine-rich secretory protein 2-like n=1 Tax=Watersipora subatra TaxID=2589382 RepID=UPI00355C2C58
MDAKGLTLLVLLFACPSSQVSLEDCIAEKYFQFTKEHTACVTKSNDATSSGVSEADQKLIVNKHNQLRALQSATNMQKMVWDDEIASIAQRWADNCDFNHDKYRTIPGRFSLGQNLALGYRLWDTAIQGWYDEVDVFTYGRESANVFSNVGHYTQIVWASSSKIGCGYSYCSNLNADFYVCNYGPAGNFDWWIPYEAGTACGACIDTCDDDKLCDCNGKVCENGGSLDLNTCECTCSQTWNIPGTCGLNCTAVEEPSSCKPGEFYDGKCFSWANVPDECPNMCNICPYSGVEFEKEDDSAAAVAYPELLMFLFISLQYLLIA